MSQLRMGKVVLRSLFRKPATLMYPQVPRIWQERTRGHIEINEADCILCGMCQRKCPSDAIIVDRKERTWTIHRMGCIQCKSCVDVCPKKCLFMKQEYTTPDVIKITDIHHIPEQEKPAAKEA
jgi:formate hydrogenlyase subunit 6/NADH:ubiquinone oxidoreductase subunit I